MRIIIRKLWSEAIDWMSAIYIYFGLKATNQQCDYSSMRHTPMLSARPITVNRAFMIHKRNYILAVIMQSFCLNAHSVCEFCERNGLHSSAERPNNIR